MSLKKSTGMNLEVFELPRVAVAILAGPYRKITLQFSDEFQSQAILVVKELERQLNVLNHSADLFVLADTSYGSCCVDQIAASHVQSDFVVHFGHACLSRNVLHLPVLFIFCEKVFDKAILDEMSSYFVGALLSQEEAKETKEYIIFSSVQYSYYNDILLDAMKELLPNFIFIKTNITRETNPARLSEWDNFTGLNLETDKNDVKLCYILERPTILPIHSQLEEFGILYVGPESRTLTTLIMSHHYNRPIFSFDPERTNKGRLEGASVNRDLMRRCLLIEKGLSAEIFGILIGTLGVHNYLAIVSRLTSLIKAAGKKYYIISVGHLNPAKLANFLEIDAFVLVACHENAFLDYSRSKEFLKPILTPFELMAALETDSEDGSSALQRWTIDFDKFLHMSDLREEILNESISLIDKGEKEYIPRYSFATGKLVQNRHQLSNDQSKEGPLLLAYEASQSGTYIHYIFNILIFLAYDRFQRRTFKGLEIKSSDDNISSTNGIHDKVERLVIGSSGTARNYTNESLNI